MAITFDPITERRFLTKGVVPLQRLLHYPRQPLSSNHQKINLHQVLIVLTPLGTCFRCQGLGHIASNCPNSKIVSLVEGDVEIEDEDESTLVSHEPIDYNKEVIYVDQGKSLVVQRSLKVAYAEDEWL